LYSLFLEYYPEESIVLTRLPGASLDWITSDQEQTGAEWKCPYVF